MKSIDHISTMINLSKRSSTTLARFPPNFLTTFFFFSLLSSPYRRPLSFPCPSRRYSSWSPPFLASHLFNNQKMKALPKTTVTNASSHSNPINRSAVSDAATLYLLFVPSYFHMLSRYLGSFLSMHSEVLHWGCMNMRKKPKECRKRSTKSLLRSTARENPIFASTFASSNSICTNSPSPLRLVRYAFDWDRELPFFRT